MKKIYLVLRYLASRAEIVKAFTTAEDANECAITLQQEYDNNTGDHDTGMSYGSYRFAVQATSLEA